MRFNLQEGQSPHPGEVINESLHLVAEEITFLEVTEEEKKKGIKRIELTVIKAGLSSNLNYYKPEILEKLPPFIEARPKMYLDHEMGFFSMGRSMKEWAATIEKVWYDSSKEAVRARARMTTNPATAWLYQEMESNPADIGCSIDARVMAHIEKQKIDGKDLEVKMIDSWVMCNSVDFVTYAAAGGGIERIAASADPSLFLGMIEHYVNQALNKQQPNTQEEVMNLKKFKEENPEAYAQLIAEAENSAAARATESKVVELTATIESLNTEITGFKTKIGELDAQVKALQTEKVELESKLDAYKTKEAQEAHRLKIDNLLKERIEAGALTEADISENFRKILYGITDDERINTLVTEREETLGKIRTDLGNGSRSKGPEAKAPAKSYVNNVESLVSDLKASRR